MNLTELHQRLARKPTYLKAYNEIGDAVLIGAAVRKLREAGMTQAELATDKDCGIVNFLPALEEQSAERSLDKLGMTAGGTSTNQ